MSVNKAAIIRYQTLDRCFRNPGRMYFWQDLVEECNQALYEFYGQDVSVKRRQLFDDIKYMESSQGWLISLDRKRFGRRVYYRYTDTNFSINNQPLNKSEAELLRSALTVLSKFTGAPQFTWIQEMLPILKDRLGLIEQSSTVIELETNPDLRGIHFLEPAFQAIVNRQVIQVTYQDFQSDIPYDIILHPYYLKQYNGRWFLFGLNHRANQSNWNLAIDRIRRISQTSERYIDSNIDWEEYFYDIVGVTKVKRGEIIEVILSVDPQLAPYVLSKPIHPTQKTSWQDGNLIVRIAVIPNHELNRLILSFGNKVEVKSPLSLRNIIAAEIRSMNESYL